MVFGFWVKRIRNSSAQCGPLQRRSYVPLTRRRRRARRERRRGEHLAGGQNILGIRENVNLHVAAAGFNLGGLGRRRRLLDRHVFNDVEQCSTTALFTARADGSSATPAPQDFCKACVWQVMDASIDLRDPNPNQ